MSEWKPIDDTVRMDYLSRERCALVPEFEGGWDVEVYGDASTVTAVYSGMTARDALDEAVSAWRREQDRTAPAAPSQEIPK